MIAGPAGEVMNLTWPPAPNPGANSLPPSSDEGATVTSELARRGPQVPTGCNPASRLTHDQDAISGDKTVIVNLPDAIPGLTPRSSRILLDILVQLATVEVLDARPEGSLDD
jgi:hypothetical protein